MYSKIKEAERRRAWPMMLSKSIRSLRMKGWNPNDWAAVAVALDALGDPAALAQHLDKYSAEVDRSATKDEVRSFRFYMVGRVHQTRGEYDLALAAYMRAAALVGSVEKRAMPMLQTGMINTFLGSYREAISSLTLALRNALQQRTRPDLLSAAHAADFLAGLFSRVDVRKAYRYLAQARRYASEIGNKHRLDWLLFTEGEIRLRQGDNSGLGLMYDALAAFESTGNRGSAHHCCARLGAFLVELDMLHEARVVLDKGASLGKNLLYNRSRTRILRLHAEVMYRMGELSASVRRQVLDRAAVLDKRALGSWELMHLRRRVLTEVDIRRFMKTLDPELFESLCLRILTDLGYSCERTPQNAPYIDIIASSDVGMSERVQWAVSCKRWNSKRVGTADIPNSDKLERLGCSGFMIMTSSRISGHAQVDLEHLRTKRMWCKVWDGVEIAQFLADHDWIIAELGTTVGSTSHPRHA